MEFEVHSIQPPTSKCGCPPAGRSRRAWGCDAQRGRRPVSTARTFLHPQLPCRRLLLLAVGCCGVLFGLFLRAGGQAPIIPVQRLSAARQRGWVWVARHTGTRMYTFERASRAPSFDHARAWLLCPGSRRRQRSCRSLLPRPVQVLGRPYQKPVPPRPLCMLRTTHARCSRPGGTAD